MMYRRMSASEALLDRYGIQWVLFPRPVPLIRLLAGSPKWQNVSEDAAAALFVRR